MGLGVGLLGKVRVARMEIARRGVWAWKGGRL